MSTFKQFSLILVSISLLSCDDDGQVDCRVFPTKVSRTIVNDSNSNITITTVQEWNYETNTLIKNNNRDPYIEYQYPSVKHFIDESAKFGKFKFTHYRFLSPGPSENLENEFNSDEKIISSLFRYRDLGEEANRITIWSGFDADNRPVLGHFKITATIYNNDNDLVDEIACENHREIINYDEENRVIEIIHPDRSDIEEYNYVQYLPEHFCEKSAIRFYFDKYMENIKTEYWINTDDISQIPDSVNSVDNEYENLEVVCKD